MYTLVTGPADKVSCEGKLDVISDFLESQQRNGIVIRRSESWVALLGLFHLFHCSNVNDLADEVFEHEFSRHRGIFVFQFVHMQVIFSHDLSILR